MGIVNDNGFRMIQAQCIYYPLTKNILWARLVVSKTLHVCKPTGKFVKSLGLTGEILTPAGLRQESSQGSPYQARDLDANGVPTTV